MKCEEYIEKNEEHDEEDEVNFQRKDASENDASKKWKWKMTSIYR